MTILTLALLGCIVALAWRANRQPAPSQTSDGDASLQPHHRRSLHQKGALACGIAAVLVGVAADVTLLTDRERIEFVMFPALFVVGGLGLLALAMLGTSKPAAERSLPAVILPVLAALLAFGLISCGGILFLVVHSH